MGGYYTVTEARTVTLYTMPEGCRPPEYTAAPTASGGWAEAGSNGVVKVVAKPGTNYFTLCYPVA